MSFESKNELETNDIINLTEQESLKTECKDIGNRWEKNCPKCGKTQTYSSKYTLLDSIKYNKWCNARKNGTRLNVK